MNTLRKLKKLLEIRRIVIFLLAAVSLGVAQHRGDNLSFQGLSQPNDVGVKGLAMGGAYTAIAGGLNSLFWNPAGLAGAKKFQVSVSGISFSNAVQENQVYRPNRYFVTLPFYLEGLYTPDPNNNGRWDYEIADSVTYNVKYPELGLDPYSEKAADWKKKEDGSFLNNIAAAVPFNFLGRKFVASASYNTRYNINDFDRNDTYLDPFLGYTEYNMPARVDGSDTLRVDWYRFQRQRSGKLHEITAALAYNVNEKIMIGGSINSLSGHTDDLQILDQVGYFDLLDENRFRFSYDTLTSQIEGRSKYSGINFDLGLLLELNNFSLGFNLTTPNTITRKYDYTTTLLDSAGTRLSGVSGEEKLELPAIYNFGVSFRPIKQFTFALDYEYAPYSKTKISPTQSDSTIHQWVDQKTIRFGMEFRPVNLISFMAGYRNIPTVFVPDGAAFRDRGPAADSYTFGFSLRFNRFGQIDTAYEIYRLKYYDQYYSNTNYALESRNSLYVAYTFSF